MSCLLGYRVGLRKYETRNYFEFFSKPFEDWTWMNDEGTHRDLRSDKLFFFEEAEGTNHSLTIRNLEHKTFYEVHIEVFNPYGQKPLPANGRLVVTPPGSCFVINARLFSNH